MLLRDGLEKLEGSEVLIFEITATVSRTLVSVDIGEAAFSGDGGGFVFSGKEPAGKSDQCMLVAVYRGDGGKYEKKKNVRVVNHDIQAIFPASHHKLLFDSPSNGVIHGLVNLWPHPASLLTYRCNLCNLERGIIA